MNHVPRMVQQILEPLGLDYQDDIFTRVIPDRKADYIRIFRALQDKFSNLRIRELRQSANAPSPESIPEIDRELGQFLDIK
ncbi:hypothetical protein Ciccas_002680 [Cichlidogyrus casuarinus]|uniref:Uncharacterized protein n=1 Tax=Cichlidogyrus casuarinus TaxID=1844966 RepID=A0ABD2QGK7_9PLAT